MRNKSDQKGEEGTTGLMLWLLLSDVFLSAQNDWGTSTESYSHSVSKPEWSLLAFQRASPDTAV